MTEKGWCRTCKQQTHDIGDGKGFQPTGDAERIEGQRVVQCRPCWMAAERLKMEASCKCGPVSQVKPRTVNRDGKRYCSACYKPRYTMSR